MKKKLGLNELKVTSFVTEIENGQEETVKGGYPDYVTRLVDNCIQDSERTYCECDNNYTQQIRCATAATCAGWACNSHYPCDWA